MKITEPPACKYCGVKMLKMKPPDFNLTDGLGWGVPFLYMCFNDECKLYVNGWKSIQANFDRKASYRAICYPDNGNYESLLVYSSDGYRGQIIEDEDEEGSTEE